VVEIMLCVWGLVGCCNSYGRVEASVLAVAMR
jgi:hypothetical protein